MRTWSIIVLFSTCPLLNCSTTPKRTDEPTVPEPLIILDAQEMGATDMDIRFEEISRTKNTSRVRITFIEGTSVASSMFIGRGYFEIGKARGFRYVATYKEKDIDDDTSENVAGFTNRADVSLAKEFGPRFSGDNGYGEPIELIDLKMFEFIGLKLD